MKKLTKKKHFSLKSVSLVKSGYNLEVEEWEYWHTMVIGEEPKAIAEKNTKFSVTPCTIPSSSSSFVFLGYSFILRGGNYIKMRDSFPCWNF